MQNKSTGEQVAIKVLKRPLQKYEAETVRLETRIQALMGRGSVNIVPAKEAILTHTHLGIVMEVRICT